MGDPMSNEHAQGSRDESHRTSHRSPDGDRQIDTVGSPKKQVSPRSLDGSHHGPPCAGLHHAGSQRLGKVTSRK